MLRLLDSQRALWVGAGLVAGAAVAVLRGDIGWWSVVVALPIAAAVWLVLRLVAEAVIRRFIPSWVTPHLTSLVSNGEPGESSSVWTDPISKRIACSEYRRFWRGVESGLASELRDKRAQLQEGLPPLTVELRSMAGRLFEHPGTVSQRSPLRYPDPVHGTIEFSEDFTDLLGHPLVQRLNQVRQLAFAFPAFPCGTHTRFAHCLGVAHLAASAVKAAVEAGVAYTVRGREPLDIAPLEAGRLVRLAAVCGLVHDLGHPPLGHTLDRFFASRFPEGSDIADKKFLPASLAALRGALEAVEGVTLDHVLRVLHEDRHELMGWDPLIGSLIDSELDVDRLDYLQRDAHFTGQQEGLVNVSSLIRGVRPYREEGRLILAFDISVLPDIEQFVYAREVMYLRCYERREKVISEWLILRAMNHLFSKHPELEQEIDHLRLLSDAQLIELVAKAQSPAAKALFDRVYRSDAKNYRQVLAVPFEAESLDSYLRGLRSDFTRRKRTLLDTVEQFVQKIADHARIDPHDILLVLPDLRLSDDRKEGLDIRLLEELPEGGYKTSRLLSEKTDESASELLRRRKYVASEHVRAAIDLKILQEEAENTGVSLLHLLRRPRNQLRLYLHERAKEAAGRAEEALRDLGVRPSVGLLRHE